MTPEIKELIEAYEAYIKLLGNEIGDLVGLHIAHGGYHSDRIEEGKKARERIQKAKEKIV